MAVCEICQKTASHGNKLSITRSHISKRAPRTWKPNLRRVKVDMNRRNKKNLCMCKMFKRWKSKKSLRCSFFVV